MGYIFNPFTKKLDNIGAVGSYVPLSSVGTPNGVAGLDNTGVVPLSQLPAAVMERIYVYAGAATLPENAGLTTANVQNGDVVKMNSTGLMYIVNNDSALSSASSFTVFTAGTAASVPYSGITGLPTTLGGYGITDAYTKTVSDGKYYLQTNPSAYISGITGSMVSSALGTQAVNTIYAGPSSGSAATPTFRSLVNSDLPNYTLTSDTQQISGSLDIQTTLNRVYGGQITALKEIGNVVYNLFATSGDLSSFTNTGSASFTFNSPGLLISGGASNYSNYFTNSYITILNRYDLSIEFTSTVAGTGISIGFPNSLGLRVDTSSGASRGTIYIENFTAGVGTTLATSATKLTYSDTTDTLRLSLKRIRNTVYAKIENLTTPSNATVYLNYQQNMTAGQPTLQGVGNPTIYAYGGTQIVTKFQYVNKELQRPTLLIMGDSNAEGWSQGTTTWAGVLASNFNSHIALQTRAGATTTTLSGAIAETLLINPRFAIVSIGTNDAIAGKLLATFQTDFSLIITQLVSNGIIPIICTVIPNSTTATNNLLVTYNTWITSTYSGLYTVIDTFTAQALAGAYNPLYNGGVHMLPAGGLNFANAVISSLNAATLPVSNIWSNLVTHGTTNILNSTGGIAIAFSGVPTQSNIDFYCTQGTNGKVLNLNYANNAVNYLSIFAKASGSSAQIQSLGGDTNIGFDFLPKGTGSYTWRSNIVNGGGTAQHVFLSLNATSGESTFVSLYNGSTASITNKSTIAFASNNASSAATVKTYIGGKAETITAGSEDTSFFVDNTIAGVRTNVMNILKKDTTLAGTLTAKGFVDGSSAATGNIGETITSIISTYTNYTTSATYQNITSISLTAGDYQIICFGTISANSATLTTGANAIFALSTTTGAIDSLSVEGDTIAYIDENFLGSSKQSVSIVKNISISSTTTYYFISQATFTLGNPQFVGKISVRRLR